MGSGAIPTATYAEYYRHGAGVFVLLCLMLLLIIAQLSSNASDLWVTYWWVLLVIIQSWKVTFQIASRRTNEIQAKYNDSTGSVADDEYTTTMLPTNFSINGTEDPMLYYLVSGDDGNVTEYIASAHSNLTEVHHHYYTWSDFLASQEFYIVIYTIFIVSSMILTPARSILFYRIFMNASKGLHKKMFSNVLAAPMRFFDTNPSGEKAWSIYRVLLPNRGALFRSVELPNGIWWLVSS